jgi:hypothetical protein
MRIVAPAHLMGIAGACPELAEAGLPYPLYLKVQQSVERNPTYGLFSI